jgi:oxygen-independent coproporphyrinogen-3 oxidase
MNVHSAAELIRRYDVPVPRYTSYPTVPAWSTQFSVADHEAALAVAARDPRPLSIYVHIPFCRELCRFCGCNVIVTRDRGRVERYLDAVAAEAQLVARLLGRRRRVSRLHLGGGTPTFLDEAQLDRLWRALGTAFDVLPGAELSVEVNPTGARVSQLELLAARGFSRLSVGVQDFAPAVQEAIGRTQTWEDTRAIVDGARRAGFRGVSVDLIYGLPRQTRESFIHTVDEALAIGPDRLSLFSFAFVPQLKPQQRRLPQAELPSGAAKLELFIAADEALRAAGYVAVGMDHFARPGDPLAEAAHSGRLGRDFQGYTVERGQDTVGLGVTSISSLAGAYAQNDKRPSEYERAVREGRLATERGIALTDDDRRRRAAITSLMCGLPVELGDFPDEARALSRFADDGIVELAGGRVRVTGSGRLFVRNVAALFDAHRNGARVMATAV